MSRPTVTRLNAKGSVRGEFNPPIVEIRDLAVYDAYSGAS
jgi:hypothetical protein